MPLIQIRMLVPLDLAIAVSDLNESNPSFQKTPSHQALPTEVFGDRVIDPIKSERGFGFTLEILNFGHAGLHAKGEFEGSELPCDSSVARVGFREVIVELGKQIQLLSLRASIDFWINNMLHRSLLDLLTRISNRGALAVGWKECGSPVVDSAVCESWADRNVSGKILILRS